MSSTPLVTVIIPTIQGREEYLFSALQTCISQGSDDLEIVVSDNSDGAARAVTESFRDSRIRYIRPEQYLTMSEHWEFALNYARGELVTFIGDDDGLMPGCITRVQQIYNRYGRKPIVHSLGNFFWPDIIDSGRQRTVEMFHPVDGNVALIKSLDFHNNVAKAVKRYVDGPMIYHNFIPKGIIASIKKRGFFFRRASPDVYSSIAISSCCDEFVFINELLTLSGQCARSNGASVRTSGRDGSKFIKENSSIFPARFPSLTIQMALLDSLLEAEWQFGVKRTCPINYNMHFLLAMKECLSLQPHGRGIREMQRIMAVAYQHRIAHRLVLDFSAFVTAYVIRKLFQSSTVKHLQNNRRKAALPADIDTIDKATHFLSNN